jgi:hypothetical protein
MTGESAIVAEHLELPSHLQGGEVGLRRSGCGRRQSSSEATATRSTRSLSCRFAACLFACDSTSLQIGCAPHRVRLLLDHCAHYSHHHYGVHHFSPRARRSQLDGGSATSSPSGRGMAISRSTWYFASAVPSRPALCPPGERQSGNTPHTSLILPLTVSAPLQTSKHAIGIAQSRGERP